MYTRPLTEIKYLVVHHSATPEDYDVEDIRKIHLGIGYSDVGYHFLVTKDGMKPGRDVNNNGAHCLAEKPPYDSFNMNRIALGLCIIGNFVSRPPGKKIVNEAAYAVKTICEKYGIPLDRKHVIGHREASYTACPGSDTMKLIYKKLGI